MSAEGPPPSKRGAALDAGPPLPGLSRHARAPRLEPLRVSLVVTHPRGVEVALLHPDVPLVLGRSKPAMLRFDDSALSRAHARFTLTGDQVLVEDLGSTNGTWHHGKRFKQAELTLGDSVRLGSLHVRIERLGGDRHASPGAPAISAASAAARPEDDASPHQDAPTLADGDFARSLATELQPGRVDLHTDPHVEHVEHAEWHVGDRVTYPGEPDMPPELLLTGIRMRPLLAQAERAATARVPVLLCGETGTGKELLARYLHERSSRRGAPMFSVQCGGIPRLAQESHLFGHDEGDFPGAVQQKGVFEEASGGTVFLDAIGELTLEAQAALLCVLDTGRIVRPHREIPVDVRVIAATHRDLDTMIAAGHFRDDLYMRFNGATLVVPPLRERKDEIVPLAEHFLRLANDANGRTVHGFRVDTFETLLRYSWPGNVRELRHAIEHAVVFTASDEITPSDLPRAVREPSLARGAILETLTEDGAAAALEASSPGLLDERSRLQREEAVHLLQALEDADWDKTRAAEALQMPLHALVYKMMVLGLRRPQM
ncbi:sigma 54-interacting transcriptional regulator [Chondromyces apiculatus]|uniref:Two component, sigma54 specific, transcriptional regulator, Fis family n=1 Tax=Chondromyces apiculatus DSM 436 TaxID=1192034 RepID=A0A017T366_9BACT|nr:sigma 54-interacting transcriptional regulator [Chondromyces apiculatus]EYF02986.1 two component, sigma54 specific, transcriptional regulator, Fis family [Chondromyces apiculatus DSM 436]